MTQQAAARRLGLARSAIAQLELAEVGGLADASGYEPPVICTPEELM